MGRIRTSVFGTLGPAALLLSLAALSCSPRKTQELLQPSQALGAVLAEEAQRAAGANRQIALILPDADWGPASTVEEALRAALKKQGANVFVAKAANLGDPMRRGQLGLKAADFSEALDKAAQAGALISLAGAPPLAAGEEARLKADHPPVLIVATAALGNLPGVPANPAQLARLLEARTIQVAIIDGADPAAPGAAKADATHELFPQNYRLLRRPD